ncbi:MAG: general secretion pathway protein GspK [Geminicoccaceae bacterium]|nr:general secretion pathway protein GspK [Geminicoccaceae bacterium]
MRLLNPRNGGAGRGAGREAGMALVVVLLFLATLAAVAVRITQDARALVLQTRNVTRGVEARAALAAGLDVATQLVRLDRVPRDGRLAWTEGRTRIEVRVERESGKVDLNAADPGLVEALMAAALPKDLDRATALAGAAVDWRDTNGLRQLQGAEAPDYRRAGMPYGPADGPFRHPGELRAVLGMDEGTAARLESAVTVATGAADPALDLAPPIVARALTATPGLNGEPNGGVAPGEGTESEEAPAAFAPDPTGLYTLDATATLPEGFAARARRLVRLDPPDTTKEYEVLQLESGLLPRGLP